MELLNSKSILDCATEQEVEKHYKEIQNFLNVLYSIHNYRTLLRFCFVDEIHKKNVEVILRCVLHESIDVIDGIDCKNGFDIRITDSFEYLTVIVYGQHYLLNDSLIS